MVATRRWSDLSPRSRKLMVVGGIVEGILKVTALVDLKRRPASQIRGSKARWATALVLVNSVGALPLAYFRYGRRSGSSAS